MNDAQMSELIDRAGEIAAALQVRNESLGQPCSFGECLVAASNLMLLRVNRRKMRDSAHFSHLHRGSENRL